MISPMPRPPKPTKFRSPRDLTFRKNDVVRAIKAAEAAGVPNPRIEIDREGTICIVAGEPAKNGVGDVNGQAQGADEWDRI
jgi:hypothetical protein